MLCVCVGEVMDVVFSVCIVRSCMFVSCMHPVAVLNAAFCMTCSLKMTCCCLPTPLCLFGVVLPYFEVTGHPVPVSSIVL